MWWILALCSAFFLGIYDIIKKISVNKNAVLPVLLFSSVSASLCVIPLIIGSLMGYIHADHILYVPSITPNEHLLILVYCSTKST